MEKLKEMSAKHAGDKADEVFKAYEECVNEGIFTKTIYII